MEENSKRRWPRPRFTLGVMLLVISVLAIPLAYVAQRRSWNLRRKAAYELLAGKGVRLESYVVVDDKVISPATSTFMGLAKWRRSLLADDQSPLVRTIDYSPAPEQAKKLAPLRDADLALLRLFPEIECVDLGNADRVTDLGLITVAGLPKLSRLRLHYLPLPKGDFLRELNEKSPLKSIYLARLDSLTGENLMPISRLPALEQFWIDRCKKVDDASLMQVTMPLTVHSLMIHQCPIGDQTILRWLMNHRYRHLSISGKMTRVSVHSLAEQTDVEQLYLKNAPLLDEDFAFLKNWKQLELLHLEAMPVRGGFLDLVGAPEKLFCIKAISTLFEDANIAKLGRFTKASTIDLSWTPISGEGFQSFPHLPQDCQLRLIGTRLTDEGMDALAQLRASSGNAGVFMTVSLPSNWTAEDFRRFEGGKPPWRVYADIFTALERKKLTGEDTAYYWSGFESRESAPLDNVPGHLMRRVLSLHEDAREKSRAQENAATKAYFEVRTK